MPSMFGKDSKKKELIKSLNTIYDKIQREHQISPGDFPDIKRMQVSNTQLILSFMHKCFSCLIYHLI